MIALLLFCLWTVNLLAAVRYTRPGTKSKLATEEFNLLHTFSRLQGVYVLIKPSQFCHYVSLVKDQQFISIAVAVRSNAVILAWKKE